MEATPMTAGPPSFPAPLSSSLQGRGLPPPLWESCIWGLELRWQLCLCPHLLPCFLSPASSATASGRFPWRAKLLWNPWHFICTSH